MKKLLFICCRIVLIIGLFQLAGCQKLIDGVFRRYNDNPTTCKIDTLRYQVYIDFPSSHAVFYNNRLGDPDSVIYDRHPTWAKGQFYYFKYDQRFRLVGFTANYDRNPDNYFFRHTYVYSDEGKIIVDTVRIREESTTRTIKFELQYDAEGRVIAETGHLLQSDRVPEPMISPFTILYEYDEQGNLSGAVDEYGTVVNFLRTSSILMFTERNYSKNAAGGGNANEQNLPTSFMGSPPNNFLSSPWGVIQQDAPQQIMYDCK